MLNFSSFEVLQAGPSSNQAPFQSVLASLEICSDSEKAGGRALLLPKSAFQNWGRLGPIHRGPSYLAPLKYSIFYRSIINISRFREIKPPLDQGPAVWCVRIPTDWLNNMICESGNTDKKVDTDDSGEWVWIRWEEIRPIHRGPTTIWRASIHAD